MKITKINLDKFKDKKDSKSKSTYKLPKNFNQFGKKDFEEPAVFTKTALDKNTTESFQKGFDEGYLKGKDEIIQTALLLEQNTKLVIENFVTQLQSFLNSYEEYKKDYLRSMTKLTLMAVRRISEKVIAENTEDVLLQALTKCADSFVKHPEIIMRAKKNVLEKIQDKVDNLLKEKEFKGVISFVFDETIIDGNCIIEWGSSGISIDSAETLKQIEDNISEFLKSI